MSVSLTVNIENIPEIQAWLSRLDPVANSRIMRNGLTKAAYAVQKDIVENQILRGGRGKHFTPTHATKLTGRNGGAGIIGSIATDLTGTPHYAEVRANKSYAAVHEFGGEIARMSMVVRAHQRSVAFGRKTKPFTVPMHFRSGHYANYPKRAFMAPGLAAVSPTFPAIFLAEWDKEASK